MKHKKRSDVLELIFPAGRARILRLLFNRPNKSRYLSELAQLSHISTSAAHEELATLLTVGVVATHFGGLRRFYWANRDHPLFHDLLTLVHDADRIRSIDVSQLRRNRRTKSAKKPRGRKYRSQPIRPSRTFSAF